MLPPLSAPESPVKSVSFQWTPTLYPLKWANTPEEVPEWDDSRGCPLWAFLDEARQKEPGLPRYTGPTWDVQPPPAMGYPRLIRASLRDHPNGEQRHDYPLLNDLSALYRHVDAWRAGKPVQVLRRKVLKLSETYGAASSEGNTLISWLELAARVRLHRSLQRALKSGGLENLETEWIMARTALIERRTIETTEYKRRRRLAGESEPVNGLYQVAALPILSDLDSVEEAVLNELEIIKAWVRTKKDSRIVRAAIANGLYDAFGGALYLGRSGAKVLLQHWGTRVCCHANLWVYYALSEMWRHNVQVKVCPVCGTLFTPTQGNNIYCEPNGPCAVKAWNQTRKARS